MAVYFQRDVKIGLDGDIAVNEKGDVDVAAATESTSQMLKNIIATDLGEIRSQRNFGANIGVLVGRTMPEALDRLAKLIRDGINRASYITLQDVSVEAYPIDVDKILVFVELRGSYVNEDGDEVLHPAGTIKYVFPYSKSKLMEWVDYD